MLALKRGPEIWADLVMPVLLMLVSWPGKKGSKIYVGRFRRLFQTAQERWDGLKACQKSRKRFSGGTPKRARELRSGRFRWPKRAGRAARHPIQAVRSSFEEPQEGPKCFSKMQPVYNDMYRNKTFKAFLRPRVVSLPEKMLY